MGAWGFLRPSAPTGAIYGGSASAAAAAWQIASQWTNGAGPGGNANNTFIVVPQAMTVSKLTLVSLSVLALAAGGRATLVKNGVDTGLTATTAVLDTPVSSSLDVVFAAGDKLAIKTDLAVSHLTWSLAVR